MKSQLNILTIQTKALGVYSVLIPKEFSILNADWSVYNVNPDAGYICFTRMDFSEQSRIEGHFDKTKYQR